MTSNEGGFEANPHGLLEAAFGLLLFSAPLDVMINAAFGTFYNMVR